MASLGLGLVVEDEPFMYMYKYIVFSKALFKHNGYECIVYMYGYLISYKFYYVHITKSYSNYNVFENEGSDRV